MKTETFQDGSTIETDEATGNRTVCGKLAHEEYFRRLRAEQITAETSPAVIAFCADTDGTRKCELIRKVVTNPILVAGFGKYSWSVWESSTPEMEKVFLTCDKAYSYYKAAMLHGTNGMAGAA